MSTQEKAPAAPKKTKRAKATDAADGMAPASWDAGATFPYAVIRTGGKQYRVSKGEMLLVEKLEVEAGATWVAEDVLFVASAPGSFQIGKPTVAGAKVSFEVLQQTLGKKILLRHHRRRQNSQKTMGHRQSLTRILVKDITA